MTNDQKVNFWYELLKEQPDISVDEMIEALRQFEKDNGLVFFWTP